MRTLRTDRCTLEPLVVAHAAPMFAVLCDPAIYEFEGGPPPSAQTLADAYQRRESRVSPDGLQTWLNWVVRLPNGELAGYVQATVLRPGASSVAYIAYVAYELASQHWRKGIGRAAVSAMIEELVTRYGVHRLVAVLKTQNYRSMGLLRNLGFAPATLEDAQTFGAEENESVMVMDKIAV